MNDPSKRSVPAWIWDFAGQHRPQYVLSVPCAVCGVVCAKLSRVPLGTVLDIPSGSIKNVLVERIDSIEVIKAFGKAQSSYDKFVAAAKEGASCYVEWMRRCNIYFCLAMSIFPATMIVVLPIGGFPSAVCYSDLGRWTQVRSFRSFFFPLA